MAAPTRRIKTSKTFVTRRSSRVAAPPRSARWGIIFRGLIEEVAGVKFSIVTGYPGAAEIDLAMQKGEVQCRAGSLEGYFGSEPTRELVEERLHARVGAWQPQARSATCLTCRPSMRFWTNEKRRM